MNVVSRGLLIATLVACSGCIGGVDDIDGTRRSAVSVPSNTQPLGVFASSAWLALSPSCENRIPANAEFRLVHGGVIVALDAAGVPVCADEVEDVQAELVARGRVTESRALGNSYLLTVGIGIPIHAGDPSPQPSTEACNGVDTAGDAHGHVRERPEDEVERGDPSPQPSVQACNRAEMPAI